MSNTYIIAKKNFFQKKFHEEKKIMQWFDIISKTSFKRILIKNKINSCQNPEFIAKQKFFQKNFYEKQNKSMSNTYIIAKKVLSKEVS